MVKTCIFKPESVKNVLDYKYQKSDPQGVGSGCATLSLKGDYDRVSAGAQEGQDAGSELCLALCCSVAFTRQVCHRSHRLESALAC